MKSDDFFQHQLKHLRNCRGGKGEGRGGRRESYFIFQAVSLSSQLSQSFSVCGRVDSCCMMILYLPRSLLIHIYVDFLISVIKHSVMVLFWCWSEMLFGCQFHRWSLCLRKISLVKRPFMHQKKYKFSDDWPEGSVGRNVVEPRVVHDPAWGRVLGGSRVLSPRDLQPRGRVLGDVVDVAGRVVLLATTEKSDPTF